MRRALGDASFAVPGKCLLCEADFQIYPHKWGGNRNKRFCSTKCANRHHYLNNRKSRDANGKRWRAKLREELLAAYGHRCACCGEKRSRFLSVEHIGGWGMRHRAEVGHSGVYVRLKHEGWPKDKYELLCMNCNFAQKWGPCPHVGEAAVVFLSA